MSRELEHRRIAVADAAVELRAADTNAGTIGFSGYATVYGTWYDIAGGPEMGGWREMVEPGAGKRTLGGRPDVRLLLNHEGTPLARTRSGTLTLTEDDYGLMSDAPALDLRNPRVQELRSIVERGDADEMSYAFAVTRQEWNRDFTERRILEYDLHVQGSDVSLVTFPANPATIAQIRAAARIDERRAALSAAPVGMSLGLAQAIAAQIAARH